MKTTLRTDITATDQYTATNAHAMADRHATADKYADQNEYSHQHAITNRHTSAHTDSPREIDCPYPLSILSKPWSVDQGFLFGRNLTTVVRLIKYSSKINKISLLLVLTK